MHRWWGIGSNPLFERKTMIYFDNAATTYFKCDAVKKGVMAYLDNPGNPDRGSHSSSLNASRMVLRTRMKLAKFFGCKDMEKVIFTSGLTQSLNTVIQGIVQQEDHVITTIYEHNSVLRPLYRIGCDLDCIEDVHCIESYIKENTKVIIVNHVSNVTGEINDIHFVGEICYKHNILFIVDTGQSAGHIPVSMQDDHIDIVCFSGHKGLMGIQGIGGICINTDVDIQPLMVGGSGIDSFNKEHPTMYPTRLEAGTLNVPGIISLYYALDYIDEIGLDTIYAHEKELENYLLIQLQNINQITVYREKEDTIGVVSFNVKGMDAAIVSDKLSHVYEICTRSGAHCAPLVHKHYGTESMVRISFGLQNTKDEVDILIKGLKEIIYGD